MQVVRLSALYTGRPYPQGDISATHFYFLLQVSSTQEKSQWPHRELNTRPLGLQCSDSSNCATACPRLLAIPVHLPLQSSYFHPHGVVWGYGGFQKIQWVFTYRIVQLVFVMKTAVFSQKIQNVYLLYRLNSCFGVLRKYVDLTVGAYVRTEFGGGIIVTRQSTWVVIHEKTIGFSRYTPVRGTGQPPSPSGICAGLNYRRVM